MKNGLFIMFTSLTLLSSAQNQSGLVIDAYGKFESSAFAEAVPAFQMLINSSLSANPEWYYYKGISEFRVGGFQEAADDFSKALEGKKYEAAIWIARLKVISGDTKGAMLFIEKYLHQAKNPDTESLQKDSLFLSLHSTPEWFTLWQYDWHNDEQKIRDEVDFYLKRKNFSQAHAIIDNNIGSGLTESVLYEMNSMVYEKEGNLPLALTEINSALVYDQGNYSLLERKANLLMKLELYNDALIIVSDLLDQYPGNFHGRFSRAEAAMMVNDYSLAIRDITIYLQYFDTDEAHFLASRIYFKSGNTFEALRQINPILEKDQSNALYYKLRGQIYYESRTFDQAAYDLSMSLDLSPRDAETNYYLGLTKLSQNQKKMACYYLKRAEYYGETRAAGYIQQNCD
jgi:tetratricopeptide (TPR) repeat protein